MPQPVAEKTECRADVRLHRARADAELLAHLLRIEPAEIPELEYFAVLLRQVFHRRLYLVVQVLVIGIVKFAQVARLQEVLLVRRVTLFDLLVLEPVEAHIVRAAEEERLHRQDLARLRATFPKRDKTLLRHLLGFVAVEYDLVRIPAQCGMVHAEQFVKCLCRSLRQLLFERFF